MICVHVYTISPVNLTGFFVGVIMSISSSRSLGEREAKTRCGLIGILTLSSECLRS